MSTVATLGYVIGVGIGLCILWSAFRCVYFGVKGCCNDFFGVCFPKRDKSSSSRPYKKVKKATQTDDDSNKPTAPPPPPPDLSLLKGDGADDSV
jgi:hypothetical protein